MLEFALENSLYCLRISSDNMYMLIGASISGIALMIFGVLAKHVIAYKRIRFEIIQDLNFTSECYSNPIDIEKCGGKLPESYTKAQEFLKQDASKLAAFADTVPKAGIRRIGVPNPVKLRETAEELMKLSDSLTVESGEKETAEPVRELNSIRVRGIRKNLGVK